MISDKLIGDNPTVQALANDLLAEMAKFDNIAAASVKLKGDAHMRLGLNVGMMYDRNEKVTIGASYRSEVKARVKKGDVDLHYANRETLEDILTSVNKILPLMGVTSPVTLPDFNNATFSAELPLPQNFSFGATYKPTDRWILSGEAQFVGWGSYKQLAVKFYPQEELGKYDIVANFLKNRFA